jgi:hypothetical protein
MKTKLMISGASFFPFSLPAHAFPKSRANATVATNICLAQICPDSLQSQWDGGYFFFQDTGRPGIEPDRVRQESYPFSAGRMCRIRTSDFGA